MTTHLQQVTEDLNRDVLLGRVLADAAFNEDLSRATNDFVQQYAKEAICFDAGDLFDICEFKIINELQRMPFDRMWVEGEWNNDIKPYRAAMLFVDNGDETVSGVGFARVGGPREWALVWASPSISLLTGECRTFSDDPDYETHLGQHLYAFRCFLSAINCSNVRRVEHKPDEKLQKARAKRGKQPLFSYWTLELEMERTESTSGLGGTHASPRVHLRRGHARKLASGKYTWVQACVVGNKKAGMIHKDYALAA